MAGYVIRKKNSYKITGSDGKEHTLPARELLTIDDISLIAKYDEEKDLGAKVGICKEFILNHAPELEKDPEIGDNEYSMIFADYISTAEAEGRKGESSASRDS